MRYVEFRLKLSLNTYFDEENFFETISYCFCKILTNKEVTAF